MSIISKIKPFFENPVKYKRLCIGTLILNVVGFVGFLNVLEIREKSKFKYYQDLNNRSPTIIIFEENTPTKLVIRVTTIIDSSTFLASKRSIKVRGASNK